MAASPSDDSELIQRLKRRDPSAMADLYDRYGARLYGVVRRIVRHAGVAEDLVQETFLQVWVRAHLLDPTCRSLGPWLLTVGRNRAVDYLRESERRGKREQEAGRPEMLPGWPSPEQDVLAADQARTLQAAFAQLNAQQQQVIELAYYEGLSQSEMAERLQQPLGTVKTWVRGALRNLRAAMGVPA